MDLLIYKLDAPADSGNTKERFEEIARCPGHHCFSCHGHSNKHKTHLLLDTIQQFPLICTVQKEEKQTPCSSEDSSAAADALHKRNQQHTTPSFKYEVLRNRGCLTQRLCNHTAKGITPSVDGDQLAARGPTCGGDRRDATHTHERTTSHWEPERTSASMRCSLQPER